MALTSMNFVARCNKSLLVTLVLMSCVHESSSESARQVASRDPASISSGLEIPLAPGNFSGFPKTALGEKVAFANDIYAAPCLPLFAVTGWAEGLTGRKSTGRILLWLHRAHIADARVFVEPCYHASPFVASPSRVEGEVSDWWFEAAMVDEAASPRLQLQRVDVPGWGIFSNPSFCGLRIAYWSLRSAAPPQGSALRGMVVDLSDRRVLMSLPLGTAELNTDNRWCLRRATWNADCSAVTFDATAYGLGIVRGDLSK